jgi:hypothetical protein
MNGVQLPGRLGCVIAPRYGAVAGRGLLACAVSAGLVLSLSARVSAQAAPSTEAAPAVPAAPPAHAAAASPPAAVNPQAIAAWVRELDADEFLARETATLRLIEAGPAALEPLRQVLSGGSLEAISRALFIVRQIGLSPDPAVQDQASGLLSELAQRQEAPVLARRAAAALAELVQQRSAQALAELEALGARLTRRESLVVLGAAGLGLEEPALTLVVDDAFRGTEDDLRRLKWLSDVRIVVLRGARATDAWVAAAAQVPELEELHLYEAAISPRGLAPLARCANLRQLGVYYTPVGDEVLAPLTKLPLLGFVKLYGTRIGAEGVEAFQKASGAAVDHRRGAFLGVGGIDLDGTCLISTVHAGSPAEQAGLLRDDVIVRFGGERVTNFSSLTQLIAQRDVGEQVEVEVVRRVVDEDGLPALRSVKTQVRLAPWEMELAVRNTRR